MNLIALQKINYGMFVVSSKYGKKLNGQIANTVFQVTAEPPSIAISINKQNLTHELISKSKIFSVSLLSQQTPMQFIGKFGFKSGRDFDKFDGISYKMGINGTPIVIENSIAYFEAELTNTLDVGTHTLFVGRITTCELISDAEPMTYSFYHTIKKGKSPIASPTYVKEEKTGRTEPMKKFKCTVCGYVYDPQLGDPDNKIKPGTPFDQIPETWICPVCGAAKSAFEPIE